MTGVAGYVAPRHLQAIQATGNDLLAALDPHDSVGILDRYFPHASFFTEFERFDRYVEKLRRLGPDRKIHYVSICSPNYLHDAHVRFALRIGADAICEKPLVLNPWNVAALQELQQESGQRVHTILQLRLHPALLALREEVSRSANDRIHDVDLTYITPRGLWYFVSWKGSLEKSGGITTNIGIHFFDLLIWIFGPVRSLAVQLLQPKKAAGYLELAKARVRWYLSLDEEDLALVPGIAPDKPYRALTIDGRAVEYSEGFTELHTKSYEAVLRGEGFGLADVMPSIELAYAIRNAQPVGLVGDYHPLARVGA